MNYQLFSSLLLSTVLGCAETVTVMPEHLSENTLQEAVTLRTLPNNASSTLLAEIVDVRGFAVSGSRLDTTITFTVNEVSTERSVNSFGLAQLESEGNYTVGTASWNEQSLPIQSTKRSNFPEIVGYETWYIPSSNAASHLAQLTDGALYAFANELWWLSERHGSLAHPVGTLSEEVLGMDSGHIDGDGILDAVVYTATEAIILRGRPDGGCILQNSYSPLDENQRFVGANIGHLNEDAHGDVAFASSSETETMVTVLDGDGAWTFKPREPMWQGYAISSAVIADENHDDYADITVIDENDVVRRFTYSIEGWIGGFPSIVNPEAFVALEGAFIGKPADINGDGNDDTIVYDGEGASTQDLVFFTIGDSIVKYSQTYTRYFAATYDSDDNGTEDVFALSDDFLHLTYLDDSTGAFAVRNLNTVPLIGPLQLKDFNKDGLVDMNVLNAQPLQVQGSIGDSEKWTPLEVRWREEDAIQMVDGLWAIGNADTNPEIEIGAIIDINGEALLRVWRYGVDFTSLAQVSDISLGNAVVTDLKFCNGSFFVISDTGSSKRLRQIDLDGSTLSTKRRADVEEDYVECASINDEMYFLLWGGTNAYEVLTSTFVLIDGGDATGWNDADIGTGTDGQTHAIRGCSGTDCQVEYADLNNDGSDELILMNADGLQVDGLGNESLTLPLQGIVSTMDIDANSREELIVTQEDGWTWIFHATGSNWSGIQGIWMSEPPVGSPVFMDVDGDSILETIRPSAAGTLLTSAYPADPIQ